MREPIVAPAEPKPVDDMPSMGKEADASKKPVDPVEDLNDQIAKDLEPKIKANEKQKADLKQEWNRNVELRMGRPASPTYETLDNDQSGFDTGSKSALNPDWFLTKTKIANLYSQCPQVQATHEAKQFAAAIPPFTKQLNYELSEKRSNVSVAMKEALADIVNAAGVGFVLVDYVARFEDHEVPAVDVSMIDPKLVDQAIKMKLIPTTTVSKVVSDAFPVSRIAPMDGIWPADFAGSDFDNGDFLGYRGRVNAAVGQVMFDLDDAQVEKAVDSLPSNKDDSLKVDTSTKPDQGTVKKISFNRVFYWRHRYDPDETALTAIWEIVWVKGITKPVKHEPWSGQRLDEKSGKYVGACKFPVRVGTTTYVSDNPIVPSDSAAGRPQVNDLRRSRAQMFMNRQRSTPLRWGNVNMIGAEMQSQINDGTYQGIIWTNGTGERAIGEVARASYPSEDLTFDQNAKSDLLESWGLNPAAIGQMQAGRKNQAEVMGAQQGSATVLGADRNEIQRLFLGIVEVLAGLMALYSEFPLLTPQEKQTMEQAWDRQHILSDMVFKIRPDSMITIDPQQRIQRISQALNLTVKSGYVNPKPIITEIMELSGLDPSEVVIDPTPPKPKDPQLSYRFSGKDDLANPLAVALLLKQKQLTLEDVNTAKQFLLEVQKPPEASAPPAGPVPPAGQPPPAGGPPVPHPQDAATHPEWSLGSRIMKRSRDVSGG